MMDSTKSQIELGFASKINQIVLSERVSDS